MVASIKIYLPGNGAGALKVWFEAVRSDDGTAEAYSVLALWVDAAGLTGRLLLLEGPAIPALLLVDEGADKRLKTWAEAMAVAGAEARRLAAAALPDLHEKLRRCAVQAGGAGYDGAAADFFGFTAIAGVATTFHLEINPVGLLPPDDSKIKSPIIRAEAEGRFLGAFSAPRIAGVALDALVRIEVLLTQDGLLQAMPVVEVPKLPHLGWTFPAFKLPQWSLNDLQFPKVDLQSFRMPLRTQLGITVAWSTQPDVAFAIDANGNLTVATSPSTMTVLLDGTTLLTAADVTLSIGDGAAKVDAGAITSGTKSRSIPGIDLSDEFGPLKVVLSDVEATITTSMPGPAGPLTLQMTLAIGRVLIQARDDPSLVLALAAKIELTYANGTLTPVLKQLDVVEPHPIKLALIAAHIVEDGVRRLLSLCQRFEIPPLNAPATPDLPSLQSLVAVLRRIGELAAAAAAWLARQGVAAARALAGLAEAVLRMFGEVIADLAKAIQEGGQAVARHVSIEVRIDVDRWQVVQIVVAPSDPGVTSKAFVRTLLGFKLAVPHEFSPALICDLEQGWMAIALQIRSGATQSINLSTDLWLENGARGTTEPVSGSETGKPDEPLLRLELTPKSSLALALAGIQDGQAFFLKKLNAQPLANDIRNGNGQVVVANGQLVLGTGRAELSSLAVDDLGITPHFQTDRILSLFRSAKPSGGATDAGQQPSSGLVEQLDQYIKVKGIGSSKRDNAQLDISLMVQIRILETTVDTEVNLQLHLESLSVALSGGLFKIAVNDPEFELLGLKGRFAGTGAAAEHPLQLDLRDGDVRLGLSEGARIDLHYDKLSNGGKGLGFSVEHFVVSRDGIDLDGVVKKDEAVTLAGIDMPFRFDQGRLSVKRSEIQAFTITGHGNLPPTLVGEAKASIELNFVQAGKTLALQAASAVLDKSADPLRCEGTQFSITVSKLGLKFVEQDGYHFYFTLTGGAEFRPSTGAFANGLLKHLSSLKITLNEAPLAADPRVLLRHIDFQVTVDPPKRSTFFDLFSFELRGVGFHPASEAFGGSPALSISGQVNFTDFGDVVSPRFDFHKLWVAPPEQGQVLPRIRFDGLGVGLSLGSMAQVTGTAIAVDGQLPTLLRPGVLPANVIPDDEKAKGFLASGSLSIQGWASMSASMGFLELEKQGVEERRQAFFIYIQQNDLSEEIPTPIGTFFLREVGFGFGYRYTLAGIAAADQARSPRELVQILDEVSKYQGSLDDVRAWLPTFDNAAMTLALRGLFSMSSASSSSQYNEAGEKDLPNLVLFDIVAALRTDLTFLMNVRAWVAYNYADWRDARLSNAAWRNAPTLTGYMYLSAPRREFLARAVYNPGAEVGNHPHLPGPLKDAMKAVRWSSTLYIRPGLFHMEYGWPYELGFSLGNESGNFFLAVEGGTVLRVEDSAVLYGLAFRARGFAKFDYSTGGDFGAAIRARAEFALGAKLIAYLSANITDSMFYGVISLDVTLEFSVQMWLRTKWFSLSASFSRSLTIHVGIELLVEPAGISGRVEASVSIGAFGRSLTLGIGFPLGDPKRLDSARVRVERFLALGLGSSYPNPEAGVPVSRPTPLPEPSRAENASRSDARVEEAAQRIEETAPLAEDGRDFGGEPGREFGEVHYWALLFPVRGSRKASHYVVQLVPRDAGPGSSELLKATHFYAAPMKNTAAATYRVTGLAGNEVLWPKAAAPDKPESDPIDIQTDWGAVFGLHGKGEGARDQAKLAELFEFGCFMAGADFSTSTPPGPAYELTDIDSIPWTTDAYLPDDAEQASLVLKKAARSRIECGPKWKRVLQIEEARSCFIATVADCAERLALLVSFDASGHPQVNERRAQALEFDPRAIGLTFVLSTERIDELFPDRKRDQAKPTASGKFSVRTRIPASGIADPYCPATPVALFNPPERMFHNGSPALNELKAARRATGILLHWDLECRWKASASAYADPEFHLKHYRIERRIEGLAPGGPPAPPPKLFEAKKAELIEIGLLNDESGKAVLDAQRKPRLVRRRHLSRLQFADNLQDIDAGLRAQLLLPATAEDRVLAMAASALTQFTRVVYSVLPVDCAGTFGAPWPDIVVDIVKPQRPQKGLLKAVARFHYDRIPALGQTFEQASQTFFELSIEEEEAHPARGLPDPTRAPALERAAQPLQLRIRTERTVAVGVFGADALTQARSEPPVPDRADARPGAGDADVTLRVGDGAHTIRVSRVARRVDAPTTAGAALQGEERSTTYHLSAADWLRFRQALDIEATERVRAARLYIRPVPTTEDDRPPPEWTPVQLQMRIGAPEMEAAVDITVERFEHPLDVRFHALTSGNITPSSGRLHLYQPAPGASLNAFLVDAEGSTSDTIRLLLDGERRAAVTLAWNARPVDIGVADSVVSRPADLAGRHSLIAGFDLFALDATAIPKGASVRSGWPERFMAPLGRVQRLPAAERGFEPCETGDFARVEVLYPSETQRLQLANKSNRRRTTWFSPAESCLLWPVRVLRRSVLTLPDETDIEALFKRGRPTRIKVTWPKEIDWPPGLAEPKLAEPTFASFDEDRHQRQQPAGGFTSPAGEQFTIQEVRQLLLGLVLVLDDSNRKLDEYADERPNDFANLKVIVTAWDGSAHRLSEVAFDVALAPNLHPILADVLDLVQYDAHDDANGRHYRRYEPVLDPAPGVNATELKGFLDETMPDRDPSGWGVLRTLGLAAALRLYDVEEGAFVRADETLRLLNAALRDVLVRYKDVPNAIGAPFVDVMFTTDGLADTSSYQGTAAVPPGSARRLAEDSALALVQVELRPTPQPLAYGYQPDDPMDPDWSGRHRRVVRYATLQRQAGEGAIAAADELLVRANSPDVLVEIEPLIRTAGETARGVLLVQGRDGQRFPEGAADTISGGLRLLPQPGEHVLAYIRFTAFIDPQLPITKQASLEQLAKLIEVTKVSTGAAIQLKERFEDLVDGMGVRQAGLAIVAAADLPARTAEEEAAGGPWGRFADLRESWVAALLFRDGIDPPDRKVEQVASSVGATPFGNTILTLMRVLGRMQGKEDLGRLPSERPKRLQLAACIGPWTRRFMEQGPAAPTLKATSDDAVGLAFAMLTRPNPWRVASNSDGKLSVTLLEKDRFGKVRKYAIRPFGRYENLVRAVQVHEQALLAKKCGTSAPALAPPGLDESAFPTGAKLRTHFADVSIDRTEPLAAPMIIATRRNDITVGDVSRPGPSVQIIVSRHPEEILSDANVRVDAGLGMRHIAVGFWREFTAPKWAREVQKGHANPADRIDLLEPFGPFRGGGLHYDRLKKPKALELIDRAVHGDVPVYQLKKQVVRDWYERHPDLWRGSYVLTLADLPYGFRLHATAHAAAGAVVSPTSVVSIGEPGYGLVLPWTVADGGPTRPWQERKVAAPSWTISDPIHRVLRVRWPLVRIVDGLFDHAKQFWLGDDDAPAVYRLPDPAVSYRLSITTQDGRFRVAEAEFSAISEPQDGRLYLAQAVGGRFEEPTTTPVAPGPVGGTRTHYELSAQLQVRDVDAQVPPEPEPSPPIFSVSGLPSIPAPSDFTVDPAGMVHWGRLAPAILGGALTIRITPPGNDPNQLPPPFPQLPPDPRWPDFKNSLDRYVAALQAYVTGPGEPRVKDVAQEIIAKVMPYAVYGLADWPGPKTGGGFQARPVLLEVPWLLGLPFATAPVELASTVGGWVWPAHPGRDAGLAGFRARIDDALAIAAAGNDVIAAVASALRTHAVAWMAYGIAMRRLGDDERWRGQPVIRRPAPDLVDTAALQINADDPFDVVATVALGADPARVEEQVESAFVALEQQRLTAEALEGLAALWFEPTRATPIHLRWAGRTAIEAALGPLTNGVPLAPQVMSVLLRKPALKSETASLKPASAALPELLDSMTEEMLFGPGRRLLIQAFHGMAVPQEDQIERSEP